MKTKNIIALLALLPVVAGFTGCKSDEETEAKPAKEVLLVEGGDIVLRSGDESKSVTVTADCAWTVTLDDPNNDFNGNLTVEPQRGTGSATLVVMTDQNTTVYGRNAFITLTSDGGLKQKIAISQTSGDATMSISARYLNFDAVPTMAQQLAITSNQGWTISVPAGIDWLHLSKTSGSAGATTVDVTVDEIQTDAARSATLTVIYGSSSAQVTVMQEGKGIISMNVYPTELAVFGAQGGEQTVQVTSNARWRAFIPSSARSWLRVEPAEGVGDGEVRVWCEPNRQTGNDRLSLVIFVAGSNNPIQQDLLIQQSSSNIDNPQPNQVSVTDLNLFDEHMLQYGEAMLGFEFFAEADVADYGLCYSTSNRQPSVGDQVVRVGAGGHEAFVEGRLNNLEMGITYYVRGYVRTSTQVFYTPNVVSFTPQQTSEPDENDNPNPGLSRRQ